MKRDKAKVIIVYILMFIIFCLVGYLIYFAMNSNKTSEENTKTDSSKQTEGTKQNLENCSFYITSEQLAELENNNNALGLCSGYNKLMLDSVILNGQTQNVYLMYYNGTLANPDESLGLYLNDKKLINGASYDTKNVLGVFNNSLFVKTISTDGSNVRVFNGEGRKFYDLEIALAKAKIQDPVFTEFAKTEPSFGTIVNTKNINSGSFSFANGEFTFSTDTKAQCKQGQLYKGSTYKVTYTGETFSNPTFVTYVNC